MAVQERPAADPATSSAPVGEAVPQGASSPPGGPPATPEAKTVGRSVALDALRGLTVALMLLVNNAAMGEFTPDQLQHAPWGDGIRLADLVFPWFLFCAGAALPFAWAAARKRQTGGLEWARKALVRAAWLVAIGCFLTSVVAHAPVLSLGVLQLIGLAGLVAALLEPASTPWRGGVAAALLVAYWAFLRFTPVPGLEPGTFAQGRNPAASLNVWLDEFGLRGLPSVAPTAALVMLGSLVGSSLKGTARHPRPGLRLAALAAAGLGLVGLGALWNLDLEFNKPHWTPSYILVGAGTATVVAAALTALERTAGSRWLWPLGVLGANALLGYVAPILFKVWVLQDWQVRRGVSVQDALVASLTGWQGPLVGGWLYTLSYIAAWWLVLWWLYRKRIFFRV